MGKPKKDRRLDELSAMARSKYMRISPRKLNLVAGMIRGSSAEKALADLQFSNRRIARDVRKVLQAAIANAENNHQLDVDRLVVREATVGKTLSIKRYRPRARGRAGRVVKPFSNLTIVVGEVEEAA